jgi:glycerophosphoryl diester phosphodiesterase
VLREKKTMANVEIKPTPGFDWRTGTHVALHSQLLWQGAEAQPLLSSFSFEALMAAKEAAPELPRGWLIKQSTDADWARLEELEAASLHTDHRRLALEDIRRIQDRGYRVFVYTVNDAEVAQTFLDAGVDGLFTDNLREFAQRFPKLI